MSEQSPASTSKRGPGNPAWVKGAASPNPRGRPRTGFALAEKIRERVDPDMIISIAGQYLALAGKFVDNEKNPLRDRVAVALQRFSAVLALADRGYMRPVSTVAIAAVTTPEIDLGHLSDDELRLRLAWLRGEHVDRHRDPLTADARELGPAVRPPPTTPAIASAKPGPATATPALHPELDHDSGDGGSDK